MLQEVQNWPSNGERFKQFSQGTNFRHSIKPETCWATNFGGWLGASIWSVETTIIHFHLHWHNVRTRQVPKEPHLRSKRKLCGPCKSSWNKTEGVRWFIEEDCEMFFQPGSIISHQSSCEPAGSQDIFGPHNQKKIQGSAINRKAHMASILGTWRFNSCENDEFDAQYYSDLLYWKMLQALRNDRQNVTTATSVETC